MDLSTVEVPRDEARRLAVEYTAAARTIKDQERRREFEAIARAYRAAAKEGQQLLALTPTLKAGGTMKRTAIFNRGRDYERRATYLLPKLAVAPWQAAYCHTLGIQEDGSIEFMDSLERTWRYSRGRFTFDAHFNFSDTCKAGRRLGENDRSAWTSMVPVVPPKHRRPRMGNRLVLWEVEDWQWTTLPLPPGDPALLRPLGGDLYVVEAVWNLTDLERMVLTGRRP